jgi:hypothetical protein
MKTFIVETRNIMNGRLAVVAVEAIATDHARLIILDGNPDLVVNRIRFAFADDKSGPLTF